MKEGLRQITQPEFQYSPLDDENYYPKPSSTRKRSNNHIGRPSRVERGLDETDRQVLDYYTANPHDQYYEAAEKIGISEESIVYRRRRLIEEGHLLGKEETILEHMRQQAHTIWEAA